MQRRNFAWRQKVLDGEMDQAFDDVENAVDNIFKDRSITGVFSGLAVSENSPTADLNVLVSAGVGHDQDGKRLKVASQQTHDCSEDKDAQDTAVQNPGNEKWLMLQLKSLVVDADEKQAGGGTPFYWTKQESFVLEIVQGTEAVIPTATKPSLPSSAIVLADIRLIYGQTQIQTSDINTDRRMEYAIIAGHMEIDASGWTKLATASVTVQDAFDDVDTKIIDTDATGKLEQDLVPDANNTRSLGGASEMWKLFASEVKSSLIPDGDTRVLGDATHRWIAHLLGTTCYADLKPDDDTHSFGDATHRWNAYLLNTTIYENIVAGAKKDMGAIGTPFQNAYFDLFRSERTGADDAEGFVFTNAKNFKKVIPLEPGRRHDFDGTNPVNVWQYHQSKSFDPGGGSETSCMWYSNDRTGHVWCLPIVVPNGVTITAVNIYWAQDVSRTTDMSAKFQKYKPNSIANIGSTTIDTFAAWTTDTIGSLTEEVNNTEEMYRVLFTASVDASDNAECAVAEVEIVGTFTSVGKAVAA